MRIRWKLRMAAAQREVWTGAQLRRLLAEKAGTEMSAASVSALFTKERRCAPPWNAPPATCSTWTPPPSSSRPGPSPISPGLPPPGAGPCRPCDHRGRCRRVSGSGTARAAAPRSASWTGSSAAGACGVWPRTPRRLPARAAGSSGSCRTAPEGASPAHGRARAAGIRSGRRTRPCAGTAGAEPASRQPGRTARNAAGPACCVRPPDGAGTAHAPGRASSRPAPAAAAANCGTTPHWACARLAGSATRTARSSGARTWPPGCRSRRTGWAISSPISRPGTAPPAPAP